MNDKKSILNALLFPNFVSGIANYTTEENDYVQETQEEGEETISENASTESIVDKF